MSNFIILLKTTEEIFGSVYTNLYGNCGRVFYNRNEDYGSKTKQNKTKNRIMEQKNSQVTAWIVLDAKLLPVQPVRSDSFLLRLTRI